MAAAIAYAILKGAEYAAGVVTFYQFILEEAIQGGCMGCYMGQKYRKLGQMDPVIERMEQHTIPALENFNDDWGWIAIWNRGSFAAFAKAGKLAVRAYKECREETTPYFEPTLSPDSTLKFTSNITRVPAPAYAGDLVTFDVAFAAVEYSAEPTEKAEFRWFVDFLEIGKGKYAGPAKRVEASARHNHVFDEPGKYKIECVICSTGHEGCLHWHQRSYTLHVKPPGAATGFINRIIREPVPATVGAQVTFTVKYGCSIDYPEPTEPLMFIWTIDDEEVSREDLVAKAHMEETEIGIEKRWTEPGEYSVKCACYLFYDEEQHLIDEAAYSIKIKALE